LYCLPWKATPNVTEERADVLEEGQPSRGNNNPTVDERRQTDAQGIVGKTAFFFSLLVGFKCCENSVRKLINPWLKTGLLYTKPVDIVFCTLCGLVPQTPVIVPNFACEIFLSIFLRGKKGTI